MREPQPAKPAPRPEAVRAAEPEPRTAERPRAIPYVPDNLDDIDSEIVRHATPVDDFPDPRVAATDTQQVAPMDTTSSSVEIHYDSDDLEIPAFLRKRGDT
jgi:outer membrane biosynthesis protein TonB